MDLNDGKACLLWQLASRLFASCRRRKLERCISPYHPNLSKSSQNRIPPYFHSNMNQVWVLSFLSFGYATEEFEVTEERLGVYRPEEHIDNPKDYADNKDAREYDQRLRGPVQPRELEVDPNTGMKK